MRTMFKNTMCSINSMRHFFAMQIHYLNVVSILVPISIKHIFRHHSRRDHIAIVCFFSDFYLK